MYILKNGEDIDNGKAGYFYIIDEKVKADAKNAISYHNEYSVAKESLEMYNNINPKSYK